MWVDHVSIYHSICMLFFTNRISAASLASAQFPPPAAAGQEATDAGMSLAQTAPSSVSPWESIPVGIKYSKYIGSATKIKTGNLEVSMEKSRINGGFSSNPCLNTSYPRFS